jgi:methionyl-tRNA synthetase
VLVEKNNNELAANSGNLVNRTIVFVKNNFDGKVPGGQLIEKDETFISLQKKKIGKITEQLDQMKLKEAIASIMEFSSNANRYFQENEPWKVIKTDKPRAATALYILTNQVKDLAILLWPFVPHASEEIFKQLNCKRGSWQDLGKLTLATGHVLGEPKPLFRKIEASEIRTTAAGKGKAGTQAKAEGRTGTSAKAEGKAGTIAAPKPAVPPQPTTFADLDLEIGEILSVEKHPNAEKLYVEMVRMGDCERQIVSGLAPYYKPEELVGKKVIIVKNLKPAKLRGVESEGMLLAAMSEGEVEALSCPECRPGDKVVAEGTHPKPREQITIDEFLLVQLGIGGYELHANGKRVLAAGKAVRSLRVSDGKVG